MNAELAAERKHREILGQLQRTNDNQKKDEETMNHDLPSEIYEWSVHYKPAVTHVMSPPEPCVRVIFSQGDQTCGRYVALSEFDRRNKEERWLYLVAMLITETGNMRRMKAAGFTPATNRPSILQEAEEITRQRQSSYGHPMYDYTRTAKMWSAILGHEVTADQAIKCMIAMKLSRLSATPGHRDSVVDMVGYGKCLDQVLEATENVEYK